MMLDLNNLPGEPEQLERNANRKFTAREDDGTGLHSYRARYYQPVLGRFVSEDPLDMVDGPNLYAYALGNPIKFVDKLGLDVFFNSYHQEIVGHAWVVIGGDSPSPANGNHSFGFWPVSQDLKGLWGNPGLVQNPDPHWKDQNFSYQRWETTPEIEKELENWIRQTYCINCQKGNPNYNLGGNDCGGWKNAVRKKLGALLAAHGIMTPNITGGDVYQGVNYPNMSFPYPIILP